MRAPTIVVALVAALVGCGEVGGNGTLGPAPGAGEGGSGPDDDAEPFAPSVQSWSAIWGLGGASGYGGQGGANVGGGDGGTAPEVCVEPRIAICHHADGNRVFTIAVGVPAAEAHLLHHGDWLGTCDAPLAGIPPEALCDVPDTTYAVCHAPGGNLENAKTLDLPLEAATAHVEHGDEPRPCE